MRTTHVVRPRPIVPFVALLAGMLAGCAGPGAGHHADVAPVGDLGHYPVSPTSESVTLQLDPDRTGYSGSVEIALHVAEQTPAFGFHAEDMSLDRVELAGDGGPIGLTLDTGDYGLVTATAERSIAPGDYTLAVDFSRDYETRAVGLYRMEQDGRGYLFTQFESVDARKAFPCWDEPAYKIPYRLTLSVPDGQVAVANTPAEAETVVDGVRNITYAESKPLPSYLVAMAVGPLDSVEIEGMSVPGRVYTVAGRAALAAEAARTAPPVLAALEDYFGRPYPYEKLDLIAVPEYWPGAMENPGLVTYAETLLLMDPAGTGVAQQRRLVSTTAHEFAHMWFGDLVTMRWWDDLWLNEAFASWLGDKITDRLHPEYDTVADGLQSVNRAMSTDARPSTKAIRKHVENPSQIMEGLGLSYSKAPAVLSMVETWIGPDVFRDGVGAYLDAHAWGNAQAADLWNALSEASGHDVGAVLSGFIEQAGVPLLEVEPATDGTVALTQRRFLNDGVDATAELWTFPAVIAYPDGDKTGHRTVMIDGPSTTVKLDGPVDWVLPNAGPSGYYRWSLPRETMLDLAGRAPEVMSAAERVGFLGNAAALLDAGILGGDDYMRVLSQFAADPDPVVLDQLLSGLGKVESAFITDDRREEFAGYVRQTLRPALERIGLAPRDDEAEATTLFRPALLGWLGDEGRDSDVRAYLRKLADDYLAQRGAVDPGLVGTALRVTAIDGDRKLFEAYRHEFETTKDPVRRRRFLGALGAFDDPTIQREALDYSLKGPLRTTESFSIAYSLPDTEAAHDLLYDWSTEHYDTLVSKLPPDFRARMVSVGGGCSTERLEKARAFFSRPEHHVDGTDSALAKLSDRVGDCVRLREREGQAVAEYLGG